MGKNKKLILILSVILLHVTMTSFSETIEVKCAGESFFIKKYDPQKKNYNYKIYYNLNNEKKLLYKPACDYLYAACVKDFNEKQYFILEEICSGSACSDFGEYRIIDPVTKKILLNKEPFESLDKFNEKTFQNQQKNIEKAKKILGYTPPLLPLINNFFNLN